jgi:hypothetical protein
MDRSRRVSRRHDADRWYSWEREQFRNDLAVYAAILLVTVVAAVVSTGPWA